MGNDNFSRRFFLKGAAAGAGLLTLSRLPGAGGLLRRANAAPAEAPAVFLVYLRGGYNALFCSADSFLGNGAFGVASNNVQRLGTSDLYVDKASLGSLPAEALTHMASIGVRHGISAHPGAQAALWTAGNSSHPVKLAAGLATGNALTCVALGGMPPGTHRAEGGASMQLVRDLKTTIAALGGTVSADVPPRELAAAGIAGAASMSGGTLLANPASGRGLAEAYPASVAMLTQAGQSFDYAEMAAAYGVTPNGMGVLPTVINNNNFRMMALGAELMVRAGASVVTANIGGWDSHGDRDGSEVRGMMADRGVTAALRAFTARTMAMTGRNVVTAIFGDFSRSLPGSDHQANLTATVVGKHVRLGTTGRVNDRVGLPTGTPSIPGFWAYLNAVLKSEAQPFGANPHALVL